MVIVQCSMKPEIDMADDRKLRGNRPAVIDDLNTAIARPRFKPAKFVAPAPVKALPPVLAAEPRFVAAAVEPKAVLAAPTIAEPVETPVVEIPVVETVAVEAPVIEPVVAEPVMPTPVIPESVAYEPIPTPEPKKEFSMNETITSMQNGTAEAIKSGAENAMSQGKAALEQVTAKSKEAIETGMKSIDEVTTMARANVEALLASTRAATSGLESIAHMVADFSRKSFEETTAAARAMATVKTPNELMQLQNDFAKTQFDAAITEMSKLSETLVKLAGEVFEPVQNRVAVATDKIKTVAATAFNR